MTHHVPAELQNYVRQSIIPQYANFDKAHQIDHVEKVIETVNIPDDQNMGVDIVEKDIDGCKVAYFIDKPGIFTAFRIRVDENGTFERKEFMFLFCIDGEAEINGTVIKKGETIFIPCNYGTLTIKGKAEFGGMTYRNL